MHTIYTNNNIHFLNTYKKNNMHFKIVRVEKELKIESGETRKQEPQGPSTI